MSHHTLEIVVHHTTDDI
ncbi:hypothetical protein [Pantoea sp. paga]|nr:hypothetical protein [Pantoea sp. paga]